MEKTDYLTSRFDESVLLLPYSLRDDARKLMRADRAAVEEIRLRTGQSASVLINDEEMIFRNKPVTKKELECVLDIVTQASIHTVRECMRSGYITVRGGYRVGICGSVIMNDNEITGIKNVSSLSIRIARQIKGVAERFINEIVTDGRFCSTLILSPPGGGKTTFLRDLIRVLSNGDKKANRCPFRIGVADERSEIAAMWEGVPQMDVGKCTDIIDAAPKAKAMLMLLRSMTPQIIAVDEITSGDDIKAIIKADHCGTGLLATAHADGIADMSRRALYKELLQSGVFKRFIVINRAKEKREYSIKDLEEIKCSDCLEQYL